MDTFLKLQADLHTSDTISAFISRCGISGKFFRILRVAPLFRRPMAHVGFLQGFCFHRHFRVLLIVFANIQKCLCVLFTAHFFLICIYAQVFLLWCSHFQFFAYFHTEKRKQRTLLSYHNICLLPIPFDRIPLIILIRLYSRSPRKRCKYRRNRRTTKFLPEPFLRTCTTRKILIRQASPVTGTEQPLTLKQRQAKVTTRNKRR